MRSRIPEMRAKHADRESGTYNKLAFIHPNNLQGTFMELNNNWFFDDTIRRKTANSKIFHLL
jgi:hypothetical protein